MKDKLTIIEYYNSDAKDLKPMKSGDIVKIAPPDSRDNTKTLFTPVVDNPTLMYEDYALDKD